eukprot:GGOE01055029.1.p1 GENE.GGOE01055029.1~~GGOE01055029.1.p1  ORF type:complete len:584 (-),score=84.91 GGOE01055029.1:63-1814(-)
MDISVKDNPMQSTRIVFGSLETKAQEITSQRDQGPTLATLETVDLSKESKEAKEKREQLLKQIELKKKSRTIAVPTTDVDVKNRLRELGLPAILFGEGPYERRERLKQETARLEALNALPPTAATKENLLHQNIGVQKQQFFTPGSQQLFLARVHIAKDSFIRAKQRLAQERERYQRLKQMRRKERDDERAQGAAQLKQYTCHGSQVGGDRPLHCCAIDPFGSQVLTGSWDMQVRLWKLPTCSKVDIFRGHADRVTGVAWRTVEQAAGSHFASCSADGTVKLWETGSTSCVANLSGHQDRVCNVAFHPCGQYVGSTSFDRTWRLWDAERQECLVEQEGHAAEVFAIDFQCDGSLACTTDLSGMGRIWDLRSGRSVLLLEGHVKQVLSCSFSPNGYHLVTGSDDNTCKIWDLRKKNTLYTIAAHSNLISCVKFQPSSGSFIATASYDQTAKLWDAHTFSLVKTLRGHQSRIMKLDVSPDGEDIVTVSYDRTFKLWRRGDTVAYNAEHVLADGAVVRGVEEAPKAADGAQTMEVDEEEEESDDPAEATTGAAAGEAEVVTNGDASDSGSEGGQEDGGDYDMPWNN